MAKGHRSQIKKERNAQKDSRPKARVTFVRLSSTKANIVLDQIKGKDVNTALAILAYTPRWGARVVEKVLKSAMRTVWLVAVAMKLSMTLIALIEENLSGFCPITKAL